MKTRTASVNLNSLLTRENIAVAFVLLAGIALRLRQYLTGRALWVDEAMLALNIVNRNFVQLFKPLDWDQGAPLGFLFVEKAFNLWFGRNEYALRLFPLLLGLLSLWMFHLLLRRLTHGLWLVAGLTLFAVNPRLIYYSSEMKQYIADVLMTIVLLWLALQIFEQPTRKRWGILTVAGLFAMWFSHPSIFVLAGIGVALFLSLLRKQDFANLRPTIGMAAVWLGNLGLLYSLTLKDLRQNSFMQNYWQDAFAPLPPWSDWGWYWSSFQKNLDTLFAITHIAWLALLILFLGWLFLFVQKRSFALALAWIFFFALLASSLKLYPSLERMVLFLTPIGILLISKALEGIHQRLSDNPVAALLVLAALGGFVFYGPVTRTFDQFVSPKYYEEIRPSMDYLQGAWREGDALYISNGGVPAFEYYAPFYGLEDISYISGRREDYEDPEAMPARLDPLKGKRRVWILFSHVYEKGNFNEKDYLIDYLDTIGNKTREVSQPGTSVFLFLYDLSR